MHARDEFRRRNLVVVQVRGVRVRRQAVVVQRLVAAVLRVREAVQVAVVDQVAVSAVALAKKLVVSVVANLTSSYHKRQQVTHRVRHRRQRALL